jgi:Zn-dependent protease with chaperone function
VNFDIKAIRHPREKVYGTLMLIIGVLLWAVLISGLFFENSRVHLIVPAIYLGLFLLVSFCARALVRAYMFGHHVMVGPEQFPAIHAIAAADAQRLGLSEVPSVFVYNSSGVMNAFAIRLIGRKRYIWLASALIDADDTDQLRFIIGHELGHHVAGHLNTIPFLLRLPAYIVPFLGAAYSRGRELTCDRIGASIVQNAEIARTALQMLACGSAKLNSQMNSAAFSAQEQLVPPIAGFLVKISATHPRTTRRVEAVGEWLGRQVERRVAEGDLAYASV